MPYKLFKPGTPIDSDVSFKVIDASGVVLLSKVEYPCFSPITYRAIPSDARSIIVFREAKRIPYTYAVMVRWAKEMTALGFPMAIGPRAPVIEFTLRLDQYAFKMHVSCALQLIRCLFETGICVVPELYFRRKVKTLDARFVALQDAHKTLKTHGGEYGMYHNVNHMVTYATNGSNVKRKVLFDRIAATKLGVYANEYTSVEDLWNGDREPESS